MNRITGMLWVAAVSLALAACSERPRTDGVETRPDSSTEEKEQDMSALKPPSADSVLYFIYQRDGDGATTYQVDGGATVSYWYGHEFDFKGKHYFTGFASKSEGDEGPDGDAGMMQEPGHVAISQATFTRVEKDGKQAWSKPDTDGYVGEFGKNAQPEDIDASRKVQSHETQDGRYLLAIPTRDFTNGVATEMFALFLFDPDNVDPLRFRAWGYLGSIAAGSENSAACDGGAVMACASSTGVLSFGPEADAGLPRLKVALTGETVAGPGQVRALGDQDAIAYRFDANSGRYTP